MSNSAVSLNIPDPATQADMEAATDVTKMVTPGRAKFHPGTCKAWLSFTEITTTSILASYNVASLADNGSGDTTITYTTAFSSANYAVVGSEIEISASVNAVFAIKNGTTPLAGSVNVVTQSNGTRSDAVQAYVAMFGDQ